MKTIHIALLMLFSLAGFSFTAQVKTDSFMVCGTQDILSKNNIEQAGSGGKMFKTTWNAGTKMAYLKYDTQKVNAAQVLKRIALAGFDNEKYLAPDEAYAKLPESCKYDRVMKVEREIKTIPITSSHQHTGKPSPTVEIKNKQTPVLKPVFDSYFALKDALVQTDGDLAAAKAGLLVAVLVDIKMESLSSDEHTVWMTREKSLKSDAKQISGTKNVQKQREHFIMLSKNMYQLIKASKPTENIYYQFCPMANDGKGANWLSKESGIKNPYYGSEMLTCGRIQETIKP